ncbi:CDP-alcohol phosphatidyltransferase [Microbacterium sp. QXD-8]|uniref:CDP-alcohol phosphatidyltransferase n=1 Tax=Microbacterium psychrotolerans TaxID=3068321 RepID=A0ABU0Z6D9_9MICO|nr:CDP-alcohol phosphatidyltransferase [Microbacterium sp. QXD-8]MDQ7879573.1 CDP-alcohol phosphatidyltransferase [Microbacterium sp. QXD-8]
MSISPGGLAPRAWRGRVGIAASVALLVVLPLVPGVLATGSVLALMRIPVESIVILLVLAVTPWRVARVVLATAFGLFVCVAVVLAAIDLGYEAALGIHFVPLDWPQLGDAYGVVAAAIGGGPAAALVATATALIAAATAALAWAALRVDAVLRRHAARGRTAIAAVTAVWVAIAALAPPLGLADPPAAAASGGAIGSAVSRTVTALETRAAVARAIAGDPFADVDEHELLATLRGKNVVFAFIESYGRVALEDDEISDGVGEVLRRGEEALTAEGYSAESAWLTSPTYGGASWLAHATLQTGVWIDSQTVYSEVVRSERLTLSAAFAAAGWRTVSDVPSNTQDWPVGRDFYRFGTLLDATNVGYRGPSFGYARIPDQYTWKHFADHQLRDQQRPVMAEIDLVSSHTPWAPLPELVPWSQIGDGSVYDGQPERSRSASDVWEDPQTVQRFYGRSIEYALGAMFSFLENVDDPDLVVVALGDHQPNAIVSGADADRDVPITIITKDPGVLASVAGWGWESGLRPGAGAPVWRMDEFRDRFFTAFGTPP